MFELIFSIVCLGVLAVEIIEVRHKCEECYPGAWDETGLLLLESRTADRRFEEGKPGKVALKG